ncbi:Hypothetical predicted protein [Olea europaea subsp. europaea]|uniref:Uncharacterized protein n=1 Tax=Olea europaea subsp. europaea TaxID=158383 RepID=A0A8S0U5N6_OLEEU|nr:Hypothetical predicted protein [Olea europaea subsp. europaea]
MDAPPAYQVMNASREPSSAYDHIQLRREQKGACSLCVAVSVASRLVNAAWRTYAAAGASGVGKNHF